MCTLSLFFSSLRCLSSSCLSFSFHPGHWWHRFICPLQFYLPLHFPHFLFSLSSFIFSRALFIEVNKWKVNFDSCGFRFAFHYSFVTGASFCILSSLFFFLSTPLCMRVFFYTHSLLFHCTHFSVSLNIYTDREGSHFSSSTIVTPASRWDGRVNHMKCKFNH